MIINEKILKNEKILERFPYCRICEIKRDKRLEMRTYVRRVSFDEIGYTYEDFLEDKFCKKFKEKKFMYLFYKKGNTSLNEYCKKNNLKQNQLQPVLCRGISINCKYIMENPILLEFLDYDKILKILKLNFMKIM